MSTQPDQKATGTRLANARPQSAPRYTSFPTAPHFHAGIDAKTYGRWLSELTPGDSLSLYLHIPFCDTLCWFCGCATRHTLRYEPVKTYLGFLLREIEMVAAAIPEGVKVSSVHWGGGSPTMLKPKDTLALNAALREHFDLTALADFSVEIDPRDFTPEHIDALCQAGLTRASIGVQDFNQTVQEAINRIQTFKVTADVISRLRARGINSINLDTIYGLPHQSENTVAATIEKIIELAPDRIALFGYAHVPWMKTHQKMIDEKALPDAAARMAQAARAAEMLTGAGYVAIGIDHFAKPGDALAIAQKNGSLHRNFQGYTTDDAGTLIGLGASSIGFLPQGYVQNTSATGQYQSAIGAGRLATARGFALTPDDRARAFAIEKLMCDFCFARNDLTARFGDAAHGVLQDADALAQSADETFFHSTGDGFAVAREGRTYVRTICAALDPYFQKGTARHSLAV